MYRLIFCDLDGTALNSDGCFSPENAAAVSALKEKGIEFIPTTGRALGEIPKTVIEHPAIRYLATSNGTAIYDKEIGAFIEADTIKGEKLRFVINLMKSYTLLRSIHANGVSYFDKPALDDYLNYRLTDFYYELLNDIVEHVEDFDALLETVSDVEMLPLFFKYDEEMADCRRRLEEAGGYHITASWPYGIEVVAAGTGKGKAITRLAEQLGVPISETIGIGDSPNDISMLDAAGLALAVDNGGEALKAHADRVICHHDEHAIRYVLENVIA